MNIMTVEQASQNFPDVIAKTISNVDETIIVSDDGAVVMVAESYWEAIQETLRQALTKGAFRWTSSSGNRVPLTGKDRG
jgi:PHD/YefM family antitoxin component YafN of YafNO toxin-antitoxin module